MAKNWTCESMNCGYYWQDEDDDFPCCHCPDDGFPAPCEGEDDFDEYEYDGNEYEDIDWDDYEPDDIDCDCGYDPYMGCFTDDC